MKRGKTVLEMSVFTFVYFMQERTELINAVLYSTCVNLSSTHGRNRKQWVGEKQKTADAINLKQKYNMLETLSRSGSKCSKTSTVYTLLTLVSFPTDAA